MSQIYGCSVLILNHKKVNYFSRLRTEKVRNYALLQNIEYDTTKYYFINEQCCCDTPCG
jgi:hypothetical protein